MRTEIEYYYKTTGKKIRKRSLAQRIKFHNLARRIKKIDVGSEDWIELQRKLSLLSCSTFDCEMRELFYKHSCKSVGKDLCVMPDVIFKYADKISIGDYVYFNYRCLVVAKADITIGNHVLIGPNVIINSGMHNYKDKNKSIREQGHKSGEIVIEDDVWIGANCIIMPGITLGKGSVIGANSFVNKDVEPYTVVAGSPIKILSTRE